MDNALKELDTALALLSTIFVNQGNVEVMATAKTCIRKAQTLIKRAKEAEVKDDGERESRKAD